jgi:hypothetical protein
VVTLRDFAWIDRKVVPIQFIFSLFVVCHLPSEGSGGLSGLVAARRSRKLRRNFFVFFVSSLEQNVHAQKLSPVAIVIA